MGRIASGGGAAALLVLLLPGRAAGQTTLARAMDMEQQGLWTPAAAAYAAALRQEPGNPIALLGLERVGERAGWGDTVIAYAERAIADDSANTTARSIEVRALRSQGKDSLAAAALVRWVAVDPRSVMPYREWAELDLAAGREAEVRDVVMRARRQLRSPAVLAPEMARAQIAAGQWTQAAVEWRAGVTAEPQYAEAAAFSLRPAPVVARDGVLGTLLAPGAGNGAALQLAADLLLGWNEPGRAWTLLRGELPPAGPRQMEALRTFADRARTLDGPGAQRSAAEAYEQLAGLEPPSTAVATRIESARAYAAAGDAAAAERVLRPLAADPAADEATRSSAIAAMVELKVRSGDPGAAAQLLGANAAALTGTQREMLGRSIATGWLRRGDLARAAAAIAGDSSLGGVRDSRLGGGVPGPARRRAPDAAQRRRDDRRPEQRRHPGGDGRAARRRGPRHAAQKHIVKRCVKKARSKNQILTCWR